MDPVPRSKLPTFGNNDGDQIIDSIGNIYEYDANTRTWIYRGATPATTTVNEKIDGLIGPDTFRKLSLLQQLINDGVDFDNFKLATESGNPYYYYFNSSDDLIRFTPEKLVSPKETIFSSTILEAGVQNFRIQDANFTPASLIGLYLQTDLGNYKITNNSEDVVTITGNSPDLRSGDCVSVIKPEQIQTRLRIEIDRGRLYQKLVRRCCVGPKGNVGEKGFPGLDGAAANDEVFMSPVGTTDNTFIWSTTVATPIDTPISLRIFRSNSDTDPIIELLYSVAGTEATTVIILDENIQIEQTTLEVDYEPTSGLFTGSITISSVDDISNWVYKARQQGPQGPQGQTGSAFLQIINQILDDPTVRSTEAIITTRKAVASDDIITLRAPLFESVPTSNLSAFDGDFIRNIESDRFMSAKVTIRESRDIQQFQFIPPEISIPNLDLPLWTPTKDCVQSRRWIQYRFNWFDLVEPKFLFQILPTPKPSEQCCQEDFFFCPNLGDACPPEGEILPPKPFPVPCDCECENPLSGEFYGGSLTLNPLNLTDSGSFVDSNDPNAQSEEDLSDVVVEDPNAIIPLSEVKASGINVIESVLDGTIQTFEQEITFLGSADIRVLLEYDSDICGGLEEERSSKSFVDSDAVSSIISLTDPSKQSSISNNGLWETKTIPVTVAFTVTGPVMQIPDVVPEAEPGQVVTPAEDCQVFCEEVSQPELIPEEIYTTSTVAVPVTLTLSVQVNTGEANYCRGYRLTVIARSNRIETEIPRTFIVGDPRTCCPPVTRILTGDTEPGTGNMGTEPPPVIDITPPPPTPEEPPPPFLPPPGFGPTAVIVTGGTVPDAPATFIELIEGGLFVMYFNIGGCTMTTISENNTVFNFDLGEQPGEILKVPGPSQVPTHQDLLNFNSFLNLTGLALNPEDVGFNSDGIFGPGTYIIGGDFTTTFGSLDPAVNIRTDQWTDTIAFINQPQTADEPETLTIIARVDASNLIDPANSLFAHELFDSGLTEGLVTISLRDATQSIVESLEQGELISFDSGSISLSYYNDLLAGYYPQILIEPTPPGFIPEPEPEPSTPGSEPPGSTPTCIGTISGFTVTPDDTEITATATYAVDLSYDFEIPSEATFLIDFDPGIDISGVTSTSISSPTLDGGFSASVASQQLMISRLGGTNMPTGTATINIADVINPSSAGSYSLDITIEDGETAEVCAGPIASTAFVITETPVSTIGGLTTTPDNSDESVVTDYTISFTTDGFIAADDVLIFTFPAGFDITSATFSSASIDGTFTVNDSGQDLIVTRNGDGTSEPAGSISATIGTVTNPTAGSYSISLEIQDSGFNNLAGPTAGTSFSINVAGVTALDYIWYNGLENITISGGFDGWSFAPTNPIPNNYQIWLEYPADHPITFVNAASDIFIDGLLGGKSYAKVGQTLRITRTSGSDHSGPMWFRISNVSNVPDDSDRVYTIQVRDAAGTTVIEESSFTMTHYTGVTTLDFYTGSEIFAVAGGVGSAGPYDVTEYPIRTGNLIQNPVGTAGCPLGVGNSFFEADNGTHVAGYGNVPMFAYPDPDPSGCHYGKFFDLGSSTSSGGNRAKEVTKWEGQTRPWVPSALTVNSITTDDQSGGGSATTVTWNFTLNTHLWDISRLIFTFPMDFTTANLQLTSKTIPIYTSSGRFGWSITRTGFGVFDISRVAGANTIEAGTYDLTFTKTFGSITNPASGSQNFSMETRTALSGGFDEQIDSTGSTSIIYT